MDRIRCIVVDDEKEARLGLRSLLNAEKDIEVVTVCKNGIEAIAAINEHRPDLIFLDIQMPDISGFEVLASLEHPRPFIIFVTAYDQFALKAFEVHALDYLLKPFSDRRLHESLDNARRQVGKSPQALDDLLTKTTPPSANGLVEHHQEHKLIFKANGKVHFIDFAQIQWIEAYDYYVKMHLAGQVHVLRETMKRLESKMPEYIIRVHKSAIVNTRFIVATRPLPNNEMEISLANGQAIKVSRSKKQTLLEALEG